MRTIILAALLGFLTATSALADSCVTTADAKKLAGAARSSFLGKCQKDAKTSCNTQAADKKLHGAAQTSFTTKCVKDAVGQ
ncbi:hypothetical protein V5F38_04955 [Xanthobacter sp. V0B-10]|uniref:hypothetical protein n=1 Tax=Xanthobacter albus TaxID=3119929 RepID=UPI00372C13A3